MKLITAEDGREPTPAEVLAWQRRINHLIPVTKGQGRDEKIRLLLGLKPSEREKRRLNLEERKSMPLDQIEEVPNEDSWYRLFQNASEA